MKSPPHIFLVDQREATSTITKQPTPSITFPSQPPSPPYHKEIVGLLPNRCSTSSLPPPSLHSSFIFQAKRISPPHLLKRPPTTAEKEFHTTNQPASHSHISTLRAISPAAQSTRFPPRFSNPYSSMTCTIRRKKKCASQFLIMSRDLPVLSLQPICQAWSSNFVRVRAPTPSCPSLFFKSRDVGPKLH